MATPQSHSESRIGRFQYRVSTCQQQHQPLRSLNLLTDFFEFKVNTTLRCFSNHPNNHRRLRRTETLFETSIFVCCKHVFEDNHQDFLRRWLPISHSSSLTYFSSECLEQLSEKIIPKVQQLFHHHNLTSHPTPDANGFPTPLNWECQVFPLDLDIVVDVPAYDDNDIEVMMVEESMAMQDVSKMVPASNEAIQSLKSFKLPEQCHICMQKFHGEDGDGDGDGDGDDVEITPMPCGHLFHHQCIVQWLQTSHMCPLCRYPLPTAERTRS